MGSMCKRTNSNLARLRFKRALLIETGAGWALLECAGLWWRDSINFRKIDLDLYFFYLLNGTITNRIMAPI
jgi:hypothetical protein